ncbi:hypothetical protein BOW53_04140 [Solemya pervernicosa gill symbiont]|uniref:Autotransporter domain-containing protein n=2 Tax=Gammaproteobacteria incertae sedis TaxID=118884 RepID=A0A1T2L889_9GAMM|nr:autotransporter outer membrane beta-barrel domain-containing protein [Candidatus Reidiella endopervernicosa]OOZ41315.1 hypothetical protein BOW53_04140 [Solemya pervernicosa gill symbiont]QKQ27700.1 autotransporter outer membrane beta-barrel domain-containing protein [Candidatus Reidiella endopervernicosa]
MVFKNPTATGLIVGLMVIQSLFADPTPPATPITVEYDDTSYILTTNYFSFSDNPELLEAQPWWEDPDLAIGLAETVQFQLGTSVDSQDTSPSGEALGPLFAYKDHLSIAWDGSGACNDCHTSDDPTYYAIDITSSVTSIENTHKAFKLFSLAEDTVIHGAHSRPLSRQVTKNKRAFWVAGDWGVDNHYNSNATAKLAEVGVGYNYGTTQINASLGKTWVRQELDYNGSADGDGKYFILESIYHNASSENLFVTLGLYHHRWDAEIERGYLFGATPYLSSGNPEISSWGVRARLDWQDLYLANSFQISPYIDLTHRDVSTESYTETGGALPASFDRHDENVTDIRLGFNASKPIANSQIAFATSLEVAHRLNYEDANISGHVPNAYTFNFTGQDYDKSTWYKVGIGVENSSDNGKFSVMLNTTTEGAMPTRWIAASWQTTF